MNKRVATAVDGQPVGYVPHEIVTLPPAAHHAQQHQDNQRPYRRHDLITRQTRHKKTYRSVSAQQQIQPQDSGKNRWPFKMLDRDSPYKSQQHEHAHHHQAVKHHREILSQNNLHVRNRRGIQQTDRPAAQLLAHQSHRQQGNIKIEIPLNAGEYPGPRTENQRGSPRHVSSDLAIGRHH